MRSKVTQKRFGVRSACGVWRGAMVCGAVVLGLVLIGNFGRDSTAMTATSIFPVSGLTEGGDMVLVSGADFPVPLPVRNYAHNGSSGGVGSVQTYTVPENGDYKLEVWGAQGGSWGENTTYGGHGGYSVGTVHLTAGEVLYVQVGGRGATLYQGTTAVGGYNGGGNGLAGGENYPMGAGGGGGTDIRIGSNTLYHRVIVAGGGSGADYSSYTKLMNIGSAGGGSSGLTLAPVHIILGFNGGGGTQIAGGASVTAAQGCPSCMGSFGRGGSTSSSYWLMAGGGGGWYGGGIGDSSGGGSGWVYTDATYNVWLAGNPTNAAGWQLNSAYYLTSAQTIAGNTAFLSPTGVSETGHTGSGYARITPLTAGLEVTFGGVPATNLMVAADGSSFSVVAPAHAAGTVDVVIDSGDGSPITLTNAYTYTSSFSVTHVNSDQGSTAGGETVTVVGTGFVDGSTSVEFGGETADCVFLSAAALSCETPPAAAAGAVDVVVDDGNSPVILAGGFNYTASGVGSPTGGGGTVTGGANSGASNSGATCAAGMAGLGVPNTGFEGLQFGQVTIPTKPTEFNKLVLK